MTYNLTNLTTGNPLGLFQTANNLTGNWLGILILIAIYAIAFLSLKYYPTKKAFAGASFIAVIMAIMLRWLSLISDRVLLISVILTIISAIGLLFTSDPESA